MSPADLLSLTPDGFTPLAGQTFLLTRAGAGDRPYEAELRTVHVPERRVPRGFRQPFSLVFRPVPGTPPAQGIYRVEHPERETMELFLTPVQAPNAPDGFHFEAVFG